MFSINKPQSSITNRFSYTTLPAFFCMLYLTFVEKCYEQKMQAKWYKCHGDSITRFLARNIEFKFWSIFLYDCRQSGISQWTLHAKFKRWKNGEYDRHNLSTKIYTTLPANLYHFACVVRDKKA